jgi:hypothetical protein
MRAIYQVVRMNMSVVVVPDKNMRVVRMMNAKKLPTFCHIRVSLDGWRYAMMIPIHGIKDPIIRILPSSLYDHSTRVFCESDNDHHDDSLAGFP